jgi:hypothetical protein
LYLGTQVYKTTSNKQLAERIGEQKLTLDQLVLILSNYKQDKQYAKLYDELMLLKVTFQPVVIRYEQGEPEMIEENGMLTIVQHEKSIVDVTPEQLTRIIDTAELVRNRLISL